METLWGLYGGAPVWEEETVELPQASPEDAVSFYGYYIRTGIVKERGDSRTKLSQRISPINHR